MIEIEVVEFLKEWTQRYLENKDIVMKRLASVEKTDEGLLVKYHDKECAFFIIPSLKEINVISNKMSKIPNFKTVVAINSLANLKIVVENWSKLVELGGKFNIYFVNPFSKTEKIWIVSPYVHNYIADLESLELGLKTMSENVEYTNEEEVKKIISS